MQQRFACLKAAAILYCDLHASIQGAGGEPCQVRRDDNVIELQQGFVDRDWLDGKHVQSGRAQMTVLQRFQKCGLLDQAAARGVDQNRPRPHHGQAFSMDEIAGSCG